MANEYSRTKLRSLAVRIQGRNLTYAEERTLDQVLEITRPKSRETVRKILSESLGRTEAQVIVALSSHNDSDRIIDDIINQLGK